MRKLIVIVLMMIAASDISFAQIEQDKVNHLIAGYTVGFAGNGLTYSLLRNSNIKLKTVKKISFFAGVAASYIAAFTKEKLDDKYYGVASREDFNYTVLGGCLGSITIRIIIGKSIPEKRYKKLKGLEY